MCVRAYVCGIHDTGISPLTSKRIYESIVPARALYGCELCDLKPDRQTETFVVRKFRAKQLLTHRLTMLMSNPNKVNSFISDIFKIMGKYKIAHVFTEYVYSGSFPRLTWKRLVFKYVHHFVEHQWTVRSQSDPSLCSLLYIHTRYNYRLVSIMTGLQDVHWAERSVVHVLNIHQSAIRMTRCHPITWTWGRD